MVTLPQVEEDQEEAVCRVLEMRFRELMQDDETERKQSVHGRPFVLSCRSSGLFSEGQLVVGQLDSSSLHA
jgi:hypothetical protein